MYYIEHFDPFDYSYTLVGYLEDKDEAFAYLAYLQDKEASRNGLHNPIAGRYKLHTSYDDLRSRPIASVQYDYIEENQQAWRKDRDTM